MFFYTKIILDFDVAAAFYIFLDKYSEKLFFIPYSTEESLFIS